MNPEFLPVLKSAVLLMLATGLLGCNVTPGSMQDIVTEMQARDFSGAILVAKDDTVLLETGFGSASCEASVANTPDTVFAIGSITKMFTDAAVYKLESLGLIDLDAPITAYLDGVPADKRSITVRQLMQHRSGLDTYHETTDLGDFEVMDKAQARQEIFSRPLLFAPDQGEEYSNSGYTLLAMIIEAVSGQSYTDYVRAELLAPAGMSRTGFWGDEFENMASTENEVLGCSNPASWNYSWVLVGNGGMVSTVGDLRRWIQALRSGRILDAESMRRTGLEQRLNSRFGTAGGSSQHDFNATIGYDGRYDELVVAISNTDSVRAEAFTMNLLGSVRSE